MTSRNTDVKCGYKAANCLTTREFMCVVKCIGVIWRYALLIAPFLWFTPSKYVNQMLFIAPIFQFYNVKIVKFSIRCITSGNYFGVKQCKMTPLITQNIENRHLFCYFPSRLSLLVSANQGIIFIHLRLQSPAARGQGMLLREHASIA